jgi:hypothetical protein
VGTADFFVKRPKVPKKGLAPAQSITFDLVFRPTAAGGRLATLQFMSRESLENPFDLTLSGTGVLSAAKKNQPWRGPWKERQKRPGDVIPIS